MILKANGRDTSSRDHNYTAEENAALAKMWKDGTPLGEIREKLGLTAGQLAGRVDRMGLPSRQRKVPATDAQITALLMEGLSNLQVAATLHVGRERVAAVREQAGMPPSPKNRWGKKVTGVTMQMVLPAFDEAEPQPSLVFPSFYAAPAVKYVPVKPGTCEYLAGDAKPYIRCTQPAIGGKSWCQCHYDVVFVRTRVRVAA